MSHRLLKLSTLAVCAAVAACTPRETPAPSKPAIDSFESCVAAGHPVMESYPRQCREPGGRSFTEDVGNRVEKQGLIQLDEPPPGQAVASPLTLRGKARGPWFFEASFPVSVLDASGATIGQGYAQADGEWMTEEFVPFKATVSFKAAPGTRGQLVLHKANASGLAQHDDRLVVPVTFR